MADTQIGHRQPIVKPNLSDKVDYEGELGVVIGRAGRAISTADALAHLAGHACYNEVGMRDWQSHTSQFVSGKNFPASAPFGPWLVTRDEFPDPAALTLATQLNGQDVQRAETRELIITAPILIAHISTFTPLGPGDVISTGTPGGVGARRDPPLFMQGGDWIEAEISGISTLANAVANE